MGLEPTLIQFCKLTHNPFLLQAPVHGPSLSQDRLPLRVKAQAWGLRPHKKEGRSTVSQHSPVSAVTVN
jgi:hypothetical protein